jgi:guanylate kinase
MARVGNLIIVSGPSGAGKSALALKVLESLPGLRFSVSYTTRAPRGSERDGIEYHFVDKSEFERLVESGELLEYAEVYGNYYGTSRECVDATLAGGDDLLLDVDVQGARSIRQKRPDSIAIFVLPPSFRVLRERLESRKLDKAYVIEQRLKIACSETVHYRHYDYLIINDDLAKSIDELRAIILGSRCRIKAQAEAAERIVATFGGMNEEDS